MFPARCFANPRPKECKTRTSLSPFAFVSYNRSQLHVSRKQFVGPTTYLTPRSRRTQKGNRDSGIMGLRARGRGRFLISEFGMRKSEIGKRKAEGRLDIGAWVEGGGRALLRSVSVNLAELRRAPRGGEGGGRADGLHRPIERFRLEWLSDPIG